MIRGGLEEIELRVLPSDSRFHAQTVAGLRRSFVLIEKTAAVGRSESLPAFHPSELHRLHRMATGHAPKVRTP